MITPEFKMTPYPHQLKELREHGADEGRCMFWEQRTGKTKGTIDQLAASVRDGSTQGAIIVAPPGVERNWVTVEFPEHMPDDVAARMRTHVWSTAKKHTKAHKEAVTALLAHAKAGEPILLAISYDAMLTKEGADCMRDLMVECPLYLIADESARIKNPKAQRTKTLHAAGKLAARRRALTGTPIASKPFDVYTQVHFVDPKFWMSELNVASHYAFKHRFGVWRMARRAGGGQYEDLQGYRDIDLLKNLIQKVSSRVTRDAIGLPPRTYKRRTFLLGDKQRRDYDELRQKYLLELDSGELLTADMAIVRLLRLQQIACGYLPAMEEGGEPQLYNYNPRLELLRELTEDEDRKTIIWARFTQDVDAIVAMLRDQHGPDSVVRYDGQVGEDEREAAKLAFQKGAAQFFVGTAATAGEGLTLSAARHLIYYSNSRKLLERLQSEARGDGGGTTVDVTDIEAEGTVDGHIIANLRASKEIGEQVMGDKFREWLT